MDDWQRSVARRVRQAAHAREMKRSEPGVYLIVGGGLVKIGCVTASYTGGMRRRIGVLRGGSPVPLELHRFIPYGRPEALERVLHRRFAAHRQHGEWFALRVLEDLDAASDEALIEMIRGHGPFMDSCSPIDTPAIPPQSPASTA